MLKKLREPINGLTHLVAAIVAVPGLIVLLFLSRGDLTKQLILSLYGVSVILMFLASALYHLIKADPKILFGLRKFDHTAIYLLIAGTYTPVCFYYLEGNWRWGILGAVWAMALVGILVKLFIIRAPRWLTAGVYLVMGWLGIIGGGEIFQAMPPAALGWLIAGGLFFTVGAVVYIAKKPDFFPNVFGFHEIWHIFVILGVLSHYILVAAYIAA